MGMGCSGVERRARRLAGRHFGTCGMCGPGGGVGGLFLRRAYGARFMPLSQRVFWFLGRFRRPSTHPSGCLGFGRPV